MFLNQTSHERSVCTSAIPKYDLSKSKTAQSSVFLNATIGSAQAQQSKKLQVLVDTGNRSSSLISLSTYEALLPQWKQANLIKPVDTQLTAAGKKQVLDVVGRAEPVDLSFVGQDGRQVRYVVRPLVVRNLQLPYILSYKDMCTMDMVVYSSEEKVALRAVKPPIELSLRPWKGPSIAGVSLGEQIVLEPMTEMIFEAMVEDGRVAEGQEFVFNPESTIAEVYEVHLARCVDTIQNGTVRVVASNWNSHPVCLPRGTTIGKAMSLTSPSSTLCIVQPKVKGPSDEEEIPVYKEQMTNQELCRLLWHSLGFHTTRSALTEEQKREVVRLFAEYREALYLSDDDVGTFSKFEAKIELKEGAQPIKCKLRPLPPHLKEQCDRQMEKWLKQGVIEPANSPWAFNLVPVAKKMSANAGPGSPVSYRFCIDLRLLNRLLKQQIGRAHV